MGGILKKDSQSICFSFEPVGRGCMIICKGFLIDRRVKGFLGKTVSAFLKSRGYVSSEHRGVVLVLETGCALLGSVQVLQSAGLEFSPCAW